MWNEWNEGCGFSLSLSTIFLQTLNIYFVLMLVIWYKFVKRYKENPAAHSLAIQKQLRLFAPVTLDAEVVCLLVFIKHIILLLLLEWFLFWVLTSIIYFCQLWSDTCTMHYHVYYCLTRNHFSWYWLTWIYIYTRRGAEVLSLTEDVDTKFKIFNFVC